MLRSVCLTLSMQCIWCLCRASLFNPLGANSIYLIKTFLYSHTNSSHSSEEEKTLAWMRLLNCVLTLGHLL